MPCDKRTLKKTRKAVRTRRNVAAWLARHGEPARAYNRATAALSRAKKKLAHASKVLAEHKAAVSPDISSSGQKISEVRGVTRYG